MTSEQKTKTTTENELSPEQRIKTAQDLMLSATEFSKIVPEIAAALHAAYFGSPKAREDLAKGKITFRRGGLVWELVRTNHHNVEEFILTKLPPIEVQNPADLHEEIHILVIRQHEVVTDAAIQYNHIFQEKGKAPIIQTDTAAAVGNTLCFLREFVSCDSLQR